MLGLAVACVVQSATMDAGPASAAGAEPRPVGASTKARWALVFSEEFKQPSADALLAQGRWHFGWFGDGILTRPVNSAETASYDRELLSVNGGVGRFTVQRNVTGKTNAGVPEPNLAAIINTDPVQTSSGFTIGYGYVEARMQQPAGDRTEALWPAFWVNGADWPTRMEIDVLEGDGTDQGNTFNLHHGPSGVDALNLNGIDRRRTVNGATSGMHTYGADIRPDGIAYYYDGKVVYRFSGSVPSAERYVVIGSSTAGTVAGPKQLVVDYVRAWRRT